MPKKRSAKSWRKSETGEEFRDVVENNIKNQALENESNDQLFFIDTGGSQKIKKKLIDEEENRGLSKFEKARIEKLMEKNKGHTNSNIKSKSSKIVDLWAEPVESKKKSAKSQTSIVAQKSSRKVQKPTNLPAVALPAPGSSYNPDFEEHQDALGEILHRDIKYTEYKEKGNKMPEGFDAKAMYNYKINLDADIDDEALLESDSEEEKNTEEKVVNPWNKPVVVNIKTRAQRHRQEIHNRRMRLIEAKKRQKKFKNDLNNIKGIANNIEHEEQEKIEKKRQNQELHELLSKQNPDVIRRGGKAIPQPPELDVYLSDEIPQSMRQMPNVYNPIYDRMNSLEKRLLVDRSRGPSGSRGNRSRKSRTKYWSPFLKE